MFVDDPAWVPRLLGLAGFVGLIGAVCWMGAVVRDPWSLPAFVRRVRPVAALAAGLLVWFGLGFLAPGPDSTSLDCVGYEEGHSRAQGLGVPVLVDFTADWCTACRQLKRDVLDHPRVVSVAEAGEFVCVVVDVTREGARERELMERYDVLSLPRIAMVDAAGEWVPSWSMAGMVSVDEVLNAVAGVAGGEAGEGGRFERALEEHGWLWAFLLVFLAGFASSLTPCVYPLIPITVGLFVATGARTRLEGLAKASVYVLGIGLTYAALGMVAALFGGLVGGVLQHPVVLGIFALLFAVFALASVGVVSVTLPVGLQSRLGAWTGRGGVLPLLLAGLAAGVLAAPCVGPILAGVLLFIAETQQVLLGGALMAVFALGMGILFLVLGTFASLVDRIPRSGGWMEAIKGVFAVVFAALALEYLSLAWPWLVGAREAVFHGWVRLF